MMHDKRARTLKTGGYGTIDNLITTVQLITSINYDQALHCFQNIQTV